MGKTCLGQIEKAFRSLGDCPGYRYLDFHKDCLSFQQAKDKVVITIDTSKTEWFQEWSAGFFLGVEAHDIVNALRSDKSLQMTVLIEKVESPFKGKDDPHLPPYERASFSSKYTITLPDAPDTAEKIYAVRRNAFKNFLRNHLDTTVSEAQWTLHELGEDRDSVFREVWQELGRDLGFLKPAAPGRPVSTDSRQESSTLAHIKEQALPS